MSAKALAVRFSSVLRALLAPAVSLAFGIAVSLAIAAVLGENPLTVLRVLIVGALGTPTDLGYSLYYATPLLLTGLSVAWAFRAGLFNVGAEGQMALGGLAMIVPGILLPNLPAAVALPLALAFAFLVGGIWGGVAGWIKAKRGCHEVLVTILLNFVAYGIVSFFILTVFKDPTTQVPETAAVGIGYRIPQMSWLGGTSPLSWSLVFSLAVVALYGFIFSRTRFGFRQKMAGAAAEVGRRAGIDIDRQIILAMFISGGLAALAASGPVLGFELKARDGFTANAGFIGIAVALLGRMSAIGVVCSALLFGILSKGALDLDLDTNHVTRDLATVIQALTVLAVACSAGLGPFIERFNVRRRSSRSQGGGR